MLNYIWAFMIIIGIIYGSLTGHMAELSNAALDSAKEAVTLCITMLGVMALWVGLMQIAQKAGIIASMTKKLRPFLLFLFPRLRYEDIALEYISTNVVARTGLGMYPRGTESHGGAWQNTAKKQSLQGSDCCQQ